MRGPRRAIDVPRQHLWASSAKMLGEVLRGRLSGALEDAVVLAQSLAAKSSVAAALSAYEAARSGRIAKMVKAASDNRDAKTAGPLARRVRNLVLAVVLRLFYEKTVVWLYTHDCGELPTSRMDGDSHDHSSRL